MDSKTTNWGLCINCKWWQTEPAAALASTTHGRCIEQSLQPYLLRVSGGSGCGLFVEGEPTRVEGAGGCPPIVTPTQ